MNLPSGVSGYVMKFSVLLARLELRDKVFMLAVSFNCAVDRLATVCDTEGTFSFDFVEFLLLIVSVDSWCGTLNGCRMGVRGDCCFRSSTLKPELWRGSKCSFPNSAINPSKKCMNTYQTHYTTKKQIFQ